MNTADLISQSALRLFQQQGFHATGVEQLSQAAGVTKKTLYRHFASKECLVQAALKQRHDEFFTQMQTFVEAQQALQRPLAYLAFIASWTQTNDFFGCTFINAAAEYSDTQSPAHQLAAQHKQQLQKYLEKLCQEAQLSPAQPLAMQLFVLGEGLIVASQVSGSTPQLIDATLAAAKALLAQTQEHLPEYPKVIVQAKILTDRP